MRTIVLRIPKELYDKPPITPQTKIKPQKHIKEQKLQGFHPTPPFNHFEFNLLPHLTPHQNPFQTLTLLNPLLAIATSLLHKKLCVDHSLKAHAVPNPGTALLTIAPTIQYILASKKRLIYSTVSKMMYPPRWPIKLALHQKN